MPLILSLFASFYFSASSTNAFQPIVKSNSFAPTISNGSFESDAVQNQTNSLTGWDVTSGQVDVVNGSSLASGSGASSGSKFLDLADGTIEQTVSGFAVGNTYTLRIDYRAYNPAPNEDNLGGFGTLADASVLIDGQEVRQGLFGGDIPGIHSKEEYDWVVCNGFEFVAQNTSLKIRIESEETGQNGLLIDNVRLVDGGLPRPGVHDFDTLTVDGDGWSRLANWSFEDNITSYIIDEENTGPPGSNPHLCGDAIPGWRVTRENTDQISTSSSILSTAPNGSKVLDIGGHGPGSIAQSIDGLAPNGLYTLEFYAARHPLWDFDIADDGADPDNMVSHLWSNGEFEKSIVRTTNQRPNNGFVRETVDLMADSNGQITFEIFSMNYLGGNNLFDSFRIIKKQQSPDVENPGNQITNVGESVSLAIQATDPDGDDLTFEAANLPAGLTINSQTGLIQGTPTTLGSSNVTVKADDGITTEDETSFSWVINGLPQFSNVDQLVSNVNVNVNRTFSASDPEDDNLTFSATGLPTGLSINADTGVVSGMPTSAGSFQVELSVSDGNGGADDLTVTWVINAPPQLNQINDLTIGKGGEIDISLSVSDPDGSQFAISATGLPNGVSLNQGARTITGIVTQIGESTVEVSVEDEFGAEASQTFQINVVQAATFGAIGKQVSKIDSNVSYKLPITNDGGRTLTFSALNLPEGLALNSSTGLIFGIPTSEGLQNVEVTVLDNNGGRDSTSFTWEINQEGPPTGGGDNQVFLPLIRR